VRLHAHRRATCGAGSGQRSQIPASYVHRSLGDVACGGARTKRVFVGCPQKVVGGGWRLKVIVQLPKAPQRKGPPTADS